MKRKMKKLGNLKFRGGYISLVFINRKQRIFFWFCHSSGLLEWKQKKICKKYLDLGTCSADGSQRPVKEIEGTGK